MGRDCRIGVVLAAGKGTRLHPITRAVPKEMMLIADAPIIDYNLRQMEEAGVKKVYVVVGYRKEAILDYVGDGSRYGLSVAYVYQEVQNGPATALLQVEPFVNETFCVVFGDEYLEPSSAMKNLIDFHTAHGCDTTVGVIAFEDARRTSIVKVDEQNRILDIVEKPPTPKFWNNLGENGTHVFEPNVFQYIRKTPPGINGEYYLSATVKLMVQDRLAVYTHVNAELHIDIGVRDSLIKASDRAILRIQGGSRSG